MRNYNMLLNFNITANIKIDVDKETIKELQEIFNRVKVVPKTYSMLCQSLKDGFEYGSEGHIYQYIQWVLERDLKPTIRDGLRDITDDLVLYLDNKGLFINVQELAVNQVVTGDCKQIEMKEQEDK